MERKHNVAEIKRLMRERQEVLGPFSALTHFLITKGISRTLAEEISKEFAAQKSEQGNLTELIAKHIKVPKDPAWGEKTPLLALVGPTGVGKTTTICKLAKELQSQHRVAVLCLNGGESDRLRFLAGQLNLPFCEKLPCQGYSLILIDTPGCNYYLPGQIDALGEQLAAVGEVEILLTLSAATKDVDLYGAIYQFSSLLPRGLVFTKLDETLTPGSLITISNKTDFPIYYTTSGDVHQADAYEITHKILTNLNEESFHYIRQMAHMCE